MKKKTNSLAANKNFVMAAIITALVGISSVVIYNYKNKTSFKYASEKAQEVEKNSQDEVNKRVNEKAKIKKARLNNGLLEVQSSDYILGNKFAPVTMIEYASLSCPHCASFSRESFNKINEEYIKTGKVKFIFRNFPLNQSALSAAIYTKCYADSEKTGKVERYYDIIKSLFKTQDSWAFGAEYLDKLKTIAKLEGMSSDDFDKCMNDKDLQNKILSKRMTSAQELQIRSTPSFFINGQISEGYVDYKTLKTIIDKELKNSKK